MASGFVFLDLQEAFYRLLRPLCVEGSYDDDALAAIFARLKLPEDSLRQLHAQLSNPTAVQQAGLPWHLANAMSALRRDTWFKFGDQPDITRTCVGSRPGDSFADILFGYAFAGVLKRVHLILEKLEVLTYFPDMDIVGLHPAAGECSQSSLLGPTWVDDLCVCIASPCADQLDRRLRTAVSTLVDCCREVGMTPNLSKGKTEVLADFRGKGSRALRQRHFGPDSTGTVDFLTEDGYHQVAIVGVYKHLGGLRHHSGQDTAEVRQRLAVAHSTLTTHRRTIFQNPTIPLAKRMELFQSLVLSRLVYGMESWIFADKLSHQRFCSAVLKLYRRLLRIPHDVHLTEQELLVQTGLPAPDELLCRARLRYLTSLYKCGTSAHWGVLRADKQWCLQIDKDLTWLWSQIANASHLADPVEHFSQWEELIAFHPKYWKKLIGRGIRHACLQRQNNETVVQFHHRIWTRLQTSFQVDAQVPPISDIPKSIFGCMSCNFQARSAGGEGVHMNKRHGHCEPVRHLFQGTQCPLCLMEFFTHSKLQRHLRYVKQCRRDLVAKGAFHVPEPGIGSAVDTALCRQHDGLAPPAWAAGPRLPSPGLPWDFAGHFSPELHDCLLEELLAMSRTLWKWHFVPSFKPDQ